jgi:hypothetical protein
LKRRKAAKSSESHMNRPELLDSGQIVIYSNLGRFPARAIVGFPVSPNTCLVPPEASFGLFLFSFGAAAMVPRRRVQAE